MIEEKKVNKKGFWKKLWRVCSLIHKNIYIVVFLIILIAIIEVIEPYIIKLIIDDLTIGVKDLHSVLWLVVLAFGVWQLASIIHFFKDRLFFSLWFVLEADLYTKAQEKGSLTSLGKLN